MAIALRNASTYASALAVAMVLAWFILTLLQDYTWQFPITVLGYLVLPPIVIALGAYVVITALIRYYKTKEPLIHRVAIGTVCVALGAVGVYQVMLWP